MGYWSHQNAYRRKRYLAQTMSRTLLAEQIRTDPATGRLRCTAKTRNVRRCLRPPMRGSDVCIHHGGKSPNTRRLALIRTGYRKAEEIVKTLGLDTAVKRDPREVLLEQVYTAAAMAQAMKAEMADVDVDALMNPESEGHAKAQMRHKLFAEWQNQAAKTAKQALDIGIDEQMVKLAEMQARVMANALKSVLMAAVLGLSEDQQRLAQRLLGQELRRLVPDVTNTPTEVMVVDGEELPYNPAMDAYMVNLSALRSPHDRAKEVRRLHDQRRYDQLKMERGE